MLPASAKRMVSDVQGTLSIWWSFEEVLGLGIYLRDLLIGRLATSRTFHDARQGMQAMTRITFIEASGETHVVDAQAGTSLMRAAVENDVTGIVADCGGTCACGTCQVYVEAAWRGTTGEPSDGEEAMLELQDDPTPGRRLSCQILVTEELDGLIVRLPASQF